MVCFSCACLSILQMSTIMHETEILALGGGGRARNTRLTWYFPINMRETFNRWCVWALLEGFELSDSYVNLFKKSVPWMPWFIVLVSREEIFYISHYGKRPQCHYSRMLDESRHCQNILWTCLPQVCVVSQIFQTSLRLPGTSRQVLNMWTVGAIIFDPA